MFRIKICGLTSSEQCRMVAEAGADAIGLNFYPNSVRFVDINVAEQIASDLQHGPRPQLVGVFVNASADTIVDCVKKASLDWVQLHGDETPQTLMEIAEAGRAISSELKIIRAFRCDESGVRSVRQYLDECEALRPGTLHAMLLDAAAAGAYGGTGHSLDWLALRRDLDVWAKQSGGDLPLPWALAGGLKSENIADAVRIARPDAVDTASGVESDPGIKSAEKTRQFVQQAKQAFA